MKSLIIFCFVQLVLFSAFGQEKRLALVIGNGNYEKGALKNPVNDALLMKETLEKLNFEVILDTNLRTKKELLNSIYLFGEKRKNYDVAFVYYAGHGVQIDGENYLLATKEKYESKLNVEDDGVNVKKILHFLEPAKNEINILVLDACRNNPFEKNWITSSRSLDNGLGLAPLNSSGNIIAFSTSAGTTASDGNEKSKNSSYCLSLVKNMMTPDLDLDQIFRNVLKEVREISGGNQRPNVYNDYEGSDFYFRKSTFTNQIIQIDSLIDSEEYDLALEKVSTVIAKSPNNKQALLRRGRIEYNKNLEYNGLHLFKADSLYPNDSEVLEYLGRYYSTIGEVEKAIKTIEKAIIIDPKDPQLFYWKARFFEENNELEKAESEYTKSLLLDSSARRFYIRADFFLRFGKYQPAIKDYTKVIEFDKNNPESFYDRANCFIVLGDYENALKDLDVAVQLAPNDSYYYNNRADFYREYLQKYDKAIDDYDKAIEFSNNDEEKMRSLNNRALIYTEQNKYDLAIKEYTMAIELVPNDPLPYSNRSNVYIKQSKFDLALIDLTKAIELDKSNPDLFNARAECYKIMGDYDNALKDLDKSIELAPKFSTYYNNRADFYSDYFQKFELARKDYEKAIELADDNEYEKMRALNNRASILSETGDDEKLNEYSKAIKLTPNEPLPYSNRAKLYLNLGKYELANLDFTKAIELDRSNPERFEARSECYIAMGNYVNALKDLDRTIQLAPNESYYYNNRADFYREFLQKYDNAFDDYDKAFELSKNNSEKMRALNNRALIYNQQNKDDLAIREYTLAMEFVVDDPLPYLNRANVYIKQSKFDLALKDLTKVIELSDYKAPAYYERANFFLNRSEFDKALIDYSLAIENATIDEKSFFYFERAIFYREYLKKEWNAYEDFKKSLELDSTNRDALIGVCDYKKSEGEIEQAIKMLDEWHSTKDISDSIRAEYFVLKGIYNSLKGSYDEAKKCFTNALEIDSKKASIFHQRGMFYEYYLNDLENSIKDYSKAIELEPENTEYYLRRSDVFFKFGNYKSQNKDISKIRKIDSKLIDFVGKEALVYASQGDFKKAIELSNEAISVSPTNYMAYLYKAKVLIKSKDFSGSEDILKKVIEMEPNDPEAFFLMGKICEQKGENFSAAYMFGITENKFSKGSYYITDDLGNTLEKSEVYYEIGVFYDKMKAHDLMCKMFSISLNLINLNQLFRLNEIKKEIQEKLKNCQN